MLTLWVSLVVAVLASYIIERGKGHENARSLLAVIFAYVALAILFTILATWLNWPLWIGCILLTGIIILSLKWSANTEEEKKEAENK
ncbi:MAG: hypothetical protein J6W11_03985 [Alphaproteobacteria bacterium]|nr:hypothetical protein [Alphaproteobacteria bacterium]